MISFPPDNPLPTKSLASPSKVTVIPFTNQAAKLCPAEPLSLMLIVSSGSPSASQIFVTSLDSIVPTTLFVFTILDSIETFFPCLIASFALEISFLSKALSRP